MQEPDACSLAPRDAPPPPIQQIANDVLAKFAAETEIEPGKGAARTRAASGVSTPRAPRARTKRLAIYDKLRDAGYPATINPTQADGGTLYQVRITGLLSETRRGDLAHPAQGRAGVGTRRSVAAVTRS